jgi:hypothetical protein
MPRNKRVFPFFLDGGVQSITFDSNVTKSWNGTSSYIEVEGTDTGTVSVGKVDSYGRPIPHGTMLLVRKVDADNTLFTVDWTDEFTDGRGGEEAVLRNVRDAILLLFKGPSVANDKGEWVNLTTDASENNVYGALTVGSTFTSNGTANFNGSSSFAGTVNLNGSVVLGNDAISDSILVRGFVVDFGSSTSVDGDAQAISADDVKKGFIEHTPAVANDSIVLPSASDIRASVLASVGRTIRIFVYNDGSVASTVDAGTGGTLKGSGSIAADTVAEFLIRQTNVGSGTEAYDVFRL